MLLSQIWDMASLGLKNQTDFFGSKFLLAGLKLKD